MVAVDLNGLSSLISAIAALVAVLLGLMNRRRLSTKHTNGAVTWLGRPKKKTIGDVVEEIRALNELLLDRTPRFDQIDKAIRDAVAEGRENMTKVMAEFEKKKEEP